MRHRLKILTAAVVAALACASAASAQWVDPGGTWPPAPVVLLVVPAEVPALTLPPDSTADTQRLEDPAPLPTVAEADSQPAAAVPDIAADRPPVPPNPIPPDTKRPPVPDLTTVDRPVVPPNPVPPTTQRPTVPDNPVPPDTDRPGRPCNPYRGCGAPPAAGL